MEMELAYLQQIYRRGGETCFQDNVELAMVMFPGLWAMGMPARGNGLGGRLLGRAHKLLAAAVLSQNDHYRVKCLRQCIYLSNNSIYQEPETASEARCLKTKAETIYAIVEGASRGDLESGQNLQRLREIDLNDSVTYSASPDDMHLDYGDASDFRPKTRVCTPQVSSDEAVATAEWYFDPCTKKRRKVTHSVSWDGTRDQSFETQFRHAALQVSHAVQSISSMMDEIAMCTSGK